MIVDSHLHIDLRGFTEQRLLNHLNKSRIDKAWLLSWEEDHPQLESYYHVSRERILEACGKYPDRLIPFYAPCPGSENFTEKLSILNSNGFRGVGELKVALQWKDEQIGELLDGMKHKVLVFHMQDKRYYSTGLSVKQKILRDVRNERFSGGIGKIAESIVSSRIFSNAEEKLKFFRGYLSDFDGLEERLIQYPQITFIAHAWKFWSSISADYKLYYNLDGRKIKGYGIIWGLLDKYPNLYCDISGGSGWNALTRDRKKASEFLNRYYEKILFGTDNTDFDFIGLIQSYRLERNKEEAIFSGNAERLLK